MPLPDLRAPSILPHPLTTSLTYNAPDSTPRMTPVPTTWLPWTFGSSSRTAPVIYPMQRCERDVPHPPLPLFHCYRTFRLPAAGYTRTRGRAAPGDPTQHAVVRGTHPPSGPTHTLPPRCRCPHRLYHGYDCAARCVNIRDATLCAAFVRGFVTRLLRVCRRTLYSLRWMVTVPFAVCANTRCPFTYPAPPAPHTPHTLRATRCTTPVTLFARYGSVTFAFTTHIPRYTRPAVRFTPLLPNHHTSPRIPFPPAYTRQHLVRDIHLIAILVLPIL